MTEQRDGEFRVEHDSLGEVRVPRDALWGPQTQRAVENFPISGERISRAHIAALGMIKAAAARANGVARRARPPTSPTRSPRAADEVADGRARRPVPDRRLPDRLGHLDEHERERGDRARSRPPRLGRTVHPNDEVNASQSSNDVFPTSVHVAAAHAARRRAAARARRAARLAARQGATSSTTSSPPGART